MLSGRALSVSVEGQTFLNKLKVLDLGPVAYKLMHPDTGIGWTKTQTSHAMREAPPLWGIARYLMFLYLVYLYPNRQIIPTWEIDQVWHHHILDTLKYARDCQMLFGRFLHHFPYFGLQGEIDQQNLQVAFTQTQALFEEHFGADVLFNGHAQQPANCEPLSHSTTLNRPRVDIEINDFLPTFSCSLME